MRPQHPCDVRRDAIFLAASKRPFTRWAELTGKEQDAFILEARRIREHLATHEPRAFI